MSETAQQRIIRIAKAEVGYREGGGKSHNNDQKYSKAVPGLEWSNRQPWCATFVSWCAMKADIANLYPRTASCDVAAAWYKSRKRWSEYPAIGAQVLYGSPRDLNHTGIVYDYDDTWVFTIEGNTNNNGSREGDGVYLKKRLRRSSNLIGYGYPAFPGGIKSADPDWNKGAQPGSPAATGGLRVDGADLSHWNDATLAGLTKAHDAGLRWVYHKATQGTDAKNNDAKYATRRGMATKAGLRFGAYHFAEPKKSDGTTQAKRFLKVAKVREGDMRPMLDLEAGDKNVYLSGLSRAHITKFVGEFVAEVKRETGVLPIIYTHVDLDDNFGCMLWVARYSDSNAEPHIPKPWKTWRVRQFSQGVNGKPRTFPGLIGKVDLNTMHEGPSDSLAWFMVPAQDVEPKPDPKPPAPEPTPDPPTPEPVPSGPTFVSAQFNSQHTDGANAQIRDVLKASDLVGLNEVESAWQRLILKTSPKFGVFPTVGTAGFVPICWRKSVFEKVGADSFRAHGGKAHVTPARYVNQVVLRHRASGKIVVRLNGQSVAHVEVAGRERVYKGAEVKKYEGQLGRAKAFFDLMRARIFDATIQGEVIAGGDFNVDALAEARLPKTERVHYFPTTSLGSIPGVEIHVPESGTHGKRAIDWTITRGLTVVRQWKGKQGASDHVPVFTELELL